MLLEFYTIGGWILDCPVTEIIFTFMFVSIVSALIGVLIFSFFFIGHSTYLELFPGLRTSGGQWLLCWSKRLVMVGEFCVLAKRLLLAPLPSRKLDEELFSPNLFVTEIHECFHCVFVLKVSYVRNGRYLKSFLQVNRRNAPALLEDVTEFINGDLYFGRHTSSGR